MSKRACQGGEPIACAFVALVAFAAACRTTVHERAAVPAVPQTAATRSVPLRGPFDVDARRALVGRPSPEPPSNVPAFPAPVVDVQGTSFYTDAAKSVVDPQLKEQNVAALKPLRSFVGAIVKLSDEWMLSKPPQPAIAATAVDALAVWARAGALLGEVNHQGAYEREWTLGSLALAYLKLRAAAGLDPASRSSVEDWLRRLANVVQPNYERPELKSSANNHAYWTGLAVATTGIVCDDRALFDWGLRRARIGIAQVQADGVLPLERDRRALALHYHVFALAPLVMLAELAAANGIPLYDEGNGAIRRLANRVIEGLGDPAAFAALVGVTQEISLPPRKTDLAWAEAYFARFADQRLAAWIAGARPLLDVRLGGDMTAAFGVP